jgi:hypothetical protein
MSNGSAARGCTSGWVVTGSTGTGRAGSGSGSGRTGSGRGRQRQRFGQRQRLDGQRLDRQRPRLDGQRLGQRLRAAGRRAPAAAEREHPVAVDQQLGRGAVAQRDRAQQLRDVAGPQHLQPAPGRHQQQVADDLHDVRLVDPALLQVGAGRPAADGVERGRPLGAVERGAR